MKYFKNTSWLLAEKVLRIAIGLMVGVWIARYLRPERYGLLNYAQSFAGLFTVVATFGLDNIVVRDLTKYEANRDSILGTAFVIKLVGSFLVLFLMAFILRFAASDRNTFFLIVIIASAVIFQSFKVIDFYFQSRVLSRYAVFANLLSLCASTIIKISLIVVNAPLIAFAWAVVFDSIVLALGYVLFYSKERMFLSKWKFDLHLAKGMLRQSWPLILSAVAVSVYMQIDQVMIKSILNSEAVGQYAAAVRLSEAWYFIPMIISNSLFPAIINAKKFSEKKYYDRLQRLYTFMMWLGIGVALLFTFISDEIVYFLYGKEYIEAGGILKVHVWAGVFTALGVASGKWFITENYQIFTFWKTFAGAVSNILLNLILIPEFGLLGAAYATLISYAIANLLFDVLSSKTRPIFFAKINAIDIRKLIRVEESA